VLAPHYLSQWVEGELTDALFIAFFLAAEIRGAIPAVYVYNFPKCAPLAIIIWRN
jgi:hypothetical protein